MTEVPRPQPSEGSASVQNARPGNPTDVASSGAPKTVSQEGLRGGQLKWNEQRAGDTGTAPPSGSNAVTPAHSSSLSEATMRYNPRYNAADEIEEDPSVAAGDPINREDPAGQSTEKPDDMGPFRSGGSNPDL